MYARRQPGSWRKPARLNSRVSRIMRLPVFSSPINHVLHTNSWARERLMPHAGRVVLIDNPPFSLMMLITASGEVANAAADAVPDVTVRVTPGLMLRFLAR